MSQRNGQSVKTLRFLRNLWWDPLGKIPFIFMLHRVRAREGRAKPLSLRLWRKHEKLFLEPRHSHGESPTVTHLPLENIHLNSSWELALPLEVSKG